MLAVQLRQAGQVALSLMLGIFLLGGGLFLLMQPATAFADDCTVTPGMAPYPSIQAAIDDTGTCTEVTVPAGTFTETLNITRSLTISGAGSSTIIDGTNSDRVVTIEGSGIVVYLNNLRLTNGDATGASTNRNGGGVLVTGGATLRGENLQIDNNIASTAAQGGFGGGLAVNDGSAYLTSTTVYSNVANRRADPFTGDGQGGGLYVNIGTLHLVNSQVLSNVAAYRAANNDFASGGGLHVNADTEVYLSGNTWQGNVARGSNSEPCDGGTACAGGLNHEGGGAIGASFPTGTANITITKDTFMGNIANSISAPDGDNASRGGAISLNTTNTGGQITATLSEVTITQNIAVVESAGTDTDDEGRGGAIYARHTTLNVQRATIYDNQAAVTGKGSGGGIYKREPLADQSLDVVNTVLAGNQASGIGSGAQIHAEYTNAAANNITTIVHATLADDTQNAHEALFYQSSDASDRLAITNTIVASHTVGIQNVNATGAATARYMLFFGNGDNHPSPGTTAFPDETGWVAGDPDPLFVNPAQNDYHLSLGSPAINAGIDAGVTDDIDNDVRPQGSGFDIGADEYVEEPMEMIYLPIVIK